MELGVGNMKSPNQKVAGGGEALESGSCQGEGEKPSVQDWVC